MTLFQVAAAACREHGLRPNGIFPCPGEVVAIRLHPDQAGRDAGSTAKRAIVSRKIRQAGATRVFFYTAGGNPVQDQEEV